MCLSFSFLRGGSCLWRNYKRPSLQGSWGMQERGCSRMSHILKSPYDRKEYREITLRNGLRALLISDMDQSTHPLPAPYVPPRQPSHKTKGSTSSETDDESDVPMSGSEPSSDTDGVDEVPGLLNCPATEKRQKKEKRAAAALCVGSGSFSDPEDIPGFAHFLEHMVFMGSKKYKKENAFDDFIAKHGGDNNAWTDTERTTFFFDVHKTYFRKALDMFAQFFISPLFLKTSMDREIMAVDNEFQTILPNDNDRYHQLIGALAFTGNPLSRFLCGSKETLKVVPEEKGIDVYGRLRDFYKRIYSAHYMTLVVQAPETLDDLQDLVYDLFEDIPNNQMPPLCFAEHKDPFVPRNFHKLYKVIPMEDCQRLDICWSLPPVYKRFKVKPLEYLGILITHEGSGSILSYLRKKSWALSLTGGNMASGFDLNKLWSGFFVRIVLTDAGMEHVSDVIRTVFEYIAMLQKCGPQAWFYSELRDIENIKFRFREEMDPIDNVEQVAENMQLYPLEHYLTGRSLLLSFDAQIIRECLCNLTPLQSCLTLWSKTYENQGICTQVDPWFNTCYSLTDIPEGWKREWEADLKPNVELFLPEKNPFIPTTLEILKVEGASEYPVQVLDNEFGRMWYKKDLKFHMPKGFILLHLMTPIVSGSVTNSALGDLLVNILQQQLQEFLYAATLTGYEFSLEVLATGIVIQVEGFSHKLPHVLELIVNHMAEFTVAQDLFDANKTQLKKCYYNEMIKSYEFARMLRFAVTEPTSHHVPDRYRVTGRLTRDMLLEFNRQLMNNIYIEGFVTGNFYRRHAVEVAMHVQKMLCHQPLSPEQLPVKRLLKVPTGDRQCRVRGVNRRDTNSCVISYYQQGPGTIRDVCLNDLLCARMKEPVFNTLRTELQLGYSVFCQPVTTNGILGFTVVVEAHANKFDMSAIAKHITNFMQTFQKTINKLTKAQFNELVKSVITGKQVEDTQLGDETSRFWMEIVDRLYVFDRQEKEICALETITHSELKAWYSKFMDPSHRHISFQVEGSKLHPMEVDSNSRASEDQEIALSSPSTTAGETEDFLKLITDGEGFVEDLTEFRKSLELHPVSKITS